MNPRIPATAAVAIAALLSGATGAAAQAAVSPAPVVFFDIAAPELANQSAFYRQVFGWTIAPDGRFAAPVLSPLQGNLRVEAAGASGVVTERVVYLGVADVTKTLADVVAHGGGIVFPRTEYPGIVVVALFTDPAGNRMGLVEMDGAKVKIPGPKKP